MDLLRPFERRSGVANPAQWLVDLFTGGLSKSGVRVSTATALEWVFDAVQARSQAIAAMPMKLYRQKGNGDREPAIDHPLYRLAHDQPHPALTSFEFRQMFNGHLDLRGNAFAQIVRNGAGAVVRLVPLHPDRVTVKREKEYAKDGTRPVQYEVTNAGFDEGGTKTLPASEILHLRGYTTDGLVGMSPIRLKAETLGLAIAVNEHSARMFSNGARPAGYLEHPNALKDEGRKNLRNSWQQVHGGVENAGRIAILEEGMKFHEVGLSNVDAQLLESRQYSRKEIASMYRVPIHMLGGDATGNFTVEQQSLEFVMYCLLPIIANWEQRWNASLLSEKEQGEYYFKFNVAGLLRGDTAARTSALRAAVGRAGEPGWITINEVREIEELNKVAGGDKLFTGVMPAEASKAVRVIAPILTDALGRAFRKEAKAVRAIVRKPDAARELDTFYAGHRALLLEAAAPVCAAARALGLPIITAEALAERSIADSRAAIAPVLPSPDAAEPVLISWETSRAASAAADILEPLTA